MNTLKKFALATIISAGAIAPLAAHAASNDDAAAPTAAHKFVISKADSKAPADFATADKDHSGKLSMHEFQLTQPMKESQMKVHEKFASLDKNHDKMLTQEEFNGTSVQ